MFDKRNLKKWEEIKPKGLRSYLIKTGIFFYGVVFFITWTVIVPIINNNFSFSFVFLKAHMTNIIIMGIFSLLAGIMLAYTGWKDLEKKYDNINS